MKKKELIKYLRKEFKKIDFENVYNVGFAFEIYTDTYIVQCLYNIETFECSLNDIANVLYIKNPKKQDVFKLNKKEHPEVFEFLPKESNEALFIRLKDKNLEKENIGIIFALSKKGFSDKDIISMRKLYKLFNNLKTPLIEFRELEFGALVTEYILRFVLNLSKSFEKTTFEKLSRFSNFAFLLSQKMGLDYVEAKRIYNAGLLYGLLFEYTPGEEDTIIPSSEKLHHILETLDLLPVTTEFEKIKKIITFLFVFPEITKIIKENLKIPLESKILTTAIIIDNLYEKFGNDLIKFRNEIRKYLEEGKFDEEILNTAFSIIPGYYYFSQKKFYLFLINKEITLNITYGKETKRIRAFVENVIDNIIHLKLIDDFEKKINMELLFEYEHEGVINILKVRILGYNNKQLRAKIIEEKVAMKGLEIKWNFPAILITRDKSHYRVISTFLGVNRIGIITTENFELKEGENVAIAFSPTGENIVVNGKVVTINKSEKIIRYTIAFGEMKESERAKIYRAIYRRQIELKSVLYE